jgi:putative ABC transport system ATP-binding protein
VTVLLLDDVSKTRGSGAQATRALFDASLAVASGEVVLLEGASGAGKTTLLAVAAGLLTPDAGRVVLAGRSLAELAPAHRRRHRARVVGFVFQRSNLLEELTAWENVLLMALLAGAPAAEARRETAEVFAQLEIGHLASRRPKELSGGDGGGVGGARARAHRPVLVLADEPTGNLDGNSGRVVAEALASCAKGRGAAVLVATHDARLEPFATRRVPIVDGRLDQGPSPAGHRLPQ